MDLKGSHRSLMAVIGDEDSVTGLLLAGIGHMDKSQVSNFMVVGPETQQDLIEKKLHELISRDDIAIVLITQNVAVRLQSILECYKSPLPAILEIPSKDQPYDPKKDVIFKRVQKIFSDDSH